MTEIFEDDLSVSEEIEHGRWKQRPLHHRAAEKALTVARREL
jgi:hypothetical protein